MMQKFKANRKAWRSLTSKKAKATALVSNIPLNPVQKQQVKRITSTRSELKYHSRDINNAVGTGTDHLLLDLTNVSQGSTDTTRIGDKLNLSSIEYVFSMTPTAATNYIVRVLFFQYKPNDAAVLTSVAGILDAGPSGNFDPWSPYDHDFKSDYTIISDRTYTSNQNGQQLVNQQKRFLSLKKQKHEITFNAGGTVGGNHIYMYVISNVAVATPITVLGRTRLFFRDS